MPLVSLEFAFAAARRRTRRARRARRRCSPACSTKARAISIAGVSPGAGREGDRDLVPLRPRPNGRADAHAARNLDRAAELLRLAVNAPRFDEEPFERVREQMNARLRHEANDPGTVASRAWRARVVSRPSLRPAGRTARWRAWPRSSAAELGDARASSDRARRAENRGRRRDRRAARGALVDEVFADLPAKGALRRSPTRASPAWARWRRRSRRAAIDHPLRPARP